MSHWQLSASGVTIVPFNDRNSRRLITAALSRDLSSTTTCASTRRLSQLQALTMCRAERVRYESEVRRRVFPSIAMTPLPVLPKRVTNFWKHLRNWSGSSRLNTRLKVSWFGTPFFNRRNLPRKSCLASAKTAISTAVRPPDNTAHSAIIKISRISYRRAPLDRGCGETHQLGLDLLLSKTEEE